jgi:hypothetical protein
MSKEAVAAKFDTISWNLSGKTGQNHKNLVSAIVVCAEVRTEQLPNTNQKLYCLGRFVGKN